MIGKRKLTVKIDKKHEDINVKIVDFININTRYSEVQLSMYGGLEEKIYFLTQCTPTPYISMEVIV